jgi:hypothetical protein
MVTQNTTIRLGSRVYLLNAIAGEPGCVIGFDRRGRALVDWSLDMPEIGRSTAHDVDTLIIDESFTARQLGLDFSDIAA